MTYAIYSRRSIERVTPLFTLNQVAFVVNIATGIYIYIYIFHLWEICEISPSGTKINAQITQTEKEKTIAASILNTSVRSWRWTNRAQRERRRMIEMCNYPAPKQFAYIDPTGKFQRLKTPILNKELMKAAVDAIPNEAVYESVYGWTGWHGGQIDAEISKTAIIGGMFLDFDDADNPQKAIRDAAEVAAYVGHCTCNFSGAKGAHVMIHCYPVDLIPDLKSSVLRGFANMLADRLPELSTMDWSVVGDTSRVHRIINSVHPKTKLHAIGLTAYELATCTIDEIKEKAKNRRGLIQVPEPSQWVTDELYRIEGEILHDRMNVLIDSKIISESLASEFISDIYEGNHRTDVYRAVCLIGSELRRIRLKNAPKTDGITGRSPEETWLRKVIEIFKVVQRMGSIQPTGSKVSTSPSEHEARCHITKLMRECGWDRHRMHEVFSHADDYKHETTERMINSLIGRG